jgi:hypothetical protein
MRMKSELKGNIRLFDWGVTGVFEKKISLIKPSQFIHRKNFGVFLGCFFVCLKTNVERLFWCLFYPLGDRVIENFTFQNYKPNRKKK